MSKTAFIGHKQIFSKTLFSQLIEAIANEIMHGCTSFLIGSHGEFDDLALSACRKLRQTYPDIEICVVVTSLHAIEKYSNTDGFPDLEVDTLMYEIEEVHFKQRITLSNKKMIDDCDTLICYVDKNAYRSGAKIAMMYAKRKGVKIINLYNNN